MKVDNITEFVTLLNVWDCWMRWDCEIRKYNWICDTVEYVGLLKEIWMWNYIILLNSWHCWISSTVERDENVKRDKTIDFVALLKKWDCWMRWECKTR